MKARALQFLKKSEPVGQGHSDILGMGQLDTKEFCGWLEGAESVGRWGFLF